MELYIDGFGQYLKDREENSVALSGFDGAAPLKEAAAVIKGQIDRGDAGTLLVTQTQGSASQRISSGTGFYW